MLGIACGAQAIVQGLHCPAHALPPTPCLAVVPALQAVLGVGWSCMAFIMVLHEKHEPLVGWGPGALRL